MTRLSKLKISWRRGKQYSYLPCYTRGRHNNNLAYSWTIPLLRTHMVKKWNKFSTNLPLAINSKNLPPNLPSTLWTAPEQPSHVMATSNSYVWWVEVIQLQNNYIGDKRIASTNYIQYKLFNILLPTTIDYLNN